MLDIGFVILCPDNNLSGLRQTVNSISNNCYNTECVAIVGNNASKQDVMKMSSVCTAYKGKNTITSLVNKGMRHLKKEWGFIIFSGSRVTRFLEKRLNRFTKNENDILFPVVDRKCNFVEGSFDGVLINKEFFKKNGKFPEDPLNNSDLNDFELAKLLWTIDANKNGAKFKGIVGLRIL